MPPLKVKETFVIGGKTIGMTCCIKVNSNMQKHCHVIHFFFNHFIEFSPTQHLALQFFGSHFESQ